MAKACSERNKYWEQNVPIHDSEKNPRKRIKTVEK